MEIEEENDLDNETLRINVLRENISPEITKNICKIEFNKNNETICGTGFFCKIDIPNNEKMPALITCLHILGDDFFKTHNSLNFILLVDGINEKKENILLKSNRIIYKNKKIDIVIIEIKEEDNLDIFSFLEIDNSFNFHGKNSINVKVYLLHYPKDYKEVYISQGNNINKKDKFSFSSNYSSYDGSSGGPIIYKNKYVIGVHNAGSNVVFNTSRIFFIKEAIKFFIDYINQEKIIYKSPYSYLDTIDIIYHIPCKSRIRFFGNEFVCRYRNICKIIYKNNELPLREYFNLTYDDIQSKDLRIKLKGVNFVTDLSEMFRFCEDLLELPNISRMDTSRVTNMNTMFEGCLKLVQLDGINRWNVENVLSMRGMFYNCSNLTSLPKINEWKTIKLNDCYEMFYGCESLKNSEVSKIENWANISEKLKKEAVSGYKYGKKTNYITYCLFENTDKTIEEVKSYGNEVIRIFNN